MNRQQEVDKHAKIAMIIISSIIIFLFIIALSGCKENQQLETDTILHNIKPCTGCWKCKRDTTIHKNNNILYWEWNSDRVMDSVEMDCGE